MRYDLAYWVEHIQPKLTPDHPDYERVMRDQEVTNVLLRNAQRKRLESAVLPADERGDSCRH